jgi:hypothetical protein
MLPEQLMVLVAQLQVVLYQQPYHTHSPQHYVATTWVLRARSSHGNITQLTHSWAGNITGLWITRHKVPARAQPLAYVLAPWQTGMTEKAPAATHRLLRGCAGWVSTMLPLARLLDVIQQQLQLLQVIAKLASVPAGMQGNPVGCCYNKHIGSKSLFTAALHMVYCTGGTQAERFTSAAGELLKMHHRKCCVPLLQHLLLLGRWQVAASLNLLFQCCSRAIGGRAR